MRWVMLLVVLVGCDFFQLDNRSHHLGVPDAYAGLQRCSDMHYSGETCANDPPCIWAEGVDAGAPGPAQECRCSGGHWTCGDACAMEQIVIGAACPLAIGTCTYGGNTCLCTVANGWQCGNCPYDVLSPAATCTAGSSCHFWDGTGSTNCTCDGTWHCP